MKLKVARWYMWVLLTWALSGLPIYVIGQGFVGTKNGAFTLEGFFASLAYPLPINSLTAFLTWLVPTILMLLPILTIPFAIRISSSR